MKCKSAISIVMGKAVDNGLMWIGDIYSNAPNNTNK